MPVKVSKIHQYLWKRFKIFEYFRDKNLTTIQNDFFSQESLLIRSYNTVTLPILL